MQLRRPKAWFALVCLSACANPVTPTGGPPDRTPPALVESTPAAGATHVQDATVRLVFSEAVEPASVVRSLTLTPAPPQRPELRVRGRIVTLRLPTPLRPNTTYVLTFDTNLRDLHGVGLQAPITLAFSTGAAINKGRIEGRVLNATTGQPVANADVYAYALLDSLPPARLPAQPDYRTQTDAEGRFRFTHLSEQPYFVIALIDRNRNRRPDPDEPFAAPPFPALQADTASAPVEIPWLLTASDTLSPIPQRIEALSNRRLRVRFSEPVRLPSRDPQSWQLFREATRPAVRQVYQTAERSPEVYLETDPLAPEAYWLRIGSVADTAGNLARNDTLRLIAVDRPDTFQLRFLGFAPGPEARLLPDQSFWLRFNAPPPPLEAAIRLTDWAEQARSFRLESETGTAFRLVPNPPLQLGERLKLVLDGRAIGIADTLWQAVLLGIPESDLGSISGLVISPDSTAPVVLELLPQRAGLPVRRITLAPGDSLFRFERIPEGRYQLRAFIDRNANQQWDGGQLMPYIPPEPLIWLAEPLQARPRWDVAPADTLRFPPIP
jgi:hypothetical protein